MEIQCEAYPWNSKHIEYILYKINKIIIFIDI